MGKRKWLSLMLTFALVISLVQTALPVVTAADADTYTSNALTVNGEATTWTVLGERPADFEDMIDPVRLAYYDDAAMNFELQHEKTGLAEGNYQLSLELFSEDANPSKTPTPSSAAYLYAETSEGVVNTPIVYSGSAWTAPARLTLKNIEVGSDGKLVIGLKMVSADKHYGYVRNMQLTQMPAFESYESHALTINDQPTTWLVFGNMPSQFGDGKDPAGLEYYDAGEMGFELQHERLDVTDGYYELSMQLFSSDANPSKTPTPSPAAYLYAETSEGMVSTPIVYTGSAWTAPARLTLKNIEVGSDGKLVVGLKMVSAADHYGYVRNMQLTASAAPAKINVKPNSAILRPGNTVQLATNTNPEQEVVYTSSDEQIATVNEQGLVIAVGNGEAIITATISEEEDVVETATSRIYVSGTLQSGYSAIQVKPVEELENEQRSDFIMGADISMLDALSAIDRKYYSADGEETPILELLQDNGVNWARLRAWVDPSDEQGNPYGAGNVDTAALVRMASQVKAVDMKLLVDLHYSDFWTDPGRQSMPKSWVKETEAQTIAELEQEVYDYTYDILQALYDQDAYPDMIQIGNEINGGMLWPYGNSAQKAKPYIKQGIQAVRDFEEDVDGQHIDIVIHRANPGDGISRLTSFFNTYADLDYDVIGLSYYPFWHGTLANLQEVMDDLAARFNKDIAIVETSYAYTLEEPMYNGQTGHIFGQAQANASNYVATPQGQANAIRDVIAAVAAVPNNKGVGIFYWEPAWLMGTDTGWGTTYAAAYQKEEISSDGGSGWANQALFNYFGEALPSLNVFESVRGSREHYVEPEIVSVDNIAITTSEGVNVAPPSQVRALFSDDTYRMIEVKSWIPADYNYHSPGEYELVGYLGNEKSITATITVRPKNYVINPGIEHADMSAWQLLNASRSNDAAYSGQYAIHFWNQASLSAKQVIPNIPNGIYELSVQTRIGIEGDSISDESVLYAKSGEETYATMLEVTGWESWKKIVVTNIEVNSGSLEIGVIVENAQNDYGDFDDWELIRISDLPGTPVPSPTPRPTPGEEKSSDAVLTSTTNNGKTILKATVSEEVTSLTIPLTEFANNKDNAELVLTWGEQTITIALSELMKHIPVSSTGSIVIERSIAEERKLALEGSTVTRLLSPVEWRVILKAANEQQQLEVPLEIAVDLDLTQVEEILSIPASSIALYTVASDGRLTYVRGIGIINDSASALSLLLQSGEMYTIAAVTRQFNDVTEQSTAVRRLVSAGLLQGDQRGSIHLQQQATRAEVSKLTAMLVELIDQEQASNNARGFTDLPDNHWAKPYIDQLTAKKLLLGVSDQQFAPNASMSYEALIVMLARLLQLPLDSDHNTSTSDQALDFNAHAWAQPSIAAVAKTGLLSSAKLQGVDYTLAVTREQLFELFYSILEYVES